MGLVQSYRKLGPLKFFGLIFGIIGWAAIGVWLSDQAGWPDSYGYHCHGRGCLYEDLWHSPALLRHGGLFPDLTFLWLWSIIAVPLGVIAWVMLRRRRDNLESPSYISDPE